MALKTIGSLWTGKAGSKAKLSGYMDGPNRTNGAKVYVFPNEKATAENRQPQYRLVVQEEDAAEPTPTKSGPVDDSFQVSDDDVPF